MLYLRTVAEYFENCFYGKQSCEEKIEITEDVNIEERSIVILEHEREGVEDDQQENKVFKWRRRDQSPCVIPGTRCFIRNIQLQRSGLNCKADARLLILVNIILQLCLSKLVEGDDDQGHEDVDKEEWKDNEEHNVEDCLFSAVPRNGSLIFIG